MAWIYLSVAGLLETVWAYSIKQSDGFTRLWPTAATLGFMCASVWLLSASMKTLPLGTAYAVWTGIGTLGAFVVGVLVLGEAASAPRILAAAMIVGGLVLMKQTSS
jgi:quaternary ammonium compound-resistance protein SugE